MKTVTQKKLLLFLFYTLMLIGCGSEPEPLPPPTIPPTETVPIENNRLDGISALIGVNISTETDSFATLDAFGNVAGFDNDIVAMLANRANVEYELIVTSADNFLEDTRVDAVISAILLPQGDERGEDKWLYTNPYLSIGQQLLLRANIDSLNTVKEISSTQKIAVVQGSYGETLGRQFFPDNQLVIVETMAEAAQKVSDFDVYGAILDSYQAEYYRQNYAQRFQIMNHNDRAKGWLGNSREYGMMVSEENQFLQTLLNQSIAKLSASTVVDLTDRWLVDTQPIEGGNVSLIGTPDDRVVVGVVGEINSLDPAVSEYHPIEWEIKYNTMAGLMQYQEGELVPALAADIPLISADFQTYTFQLRENLFFLDGTPFNAQTLKASFLRKQNQFNDSLNRYLLDEDEDGLIDSNAIQILDEYQVVITLAQSTPEFLSLLATAPFSVGNPNCIDYEQFELRTCSGIGAYHIRRFDEDRIMRLEPNVNWPFATGDELMVEIRFFATEGALKTALTTKPFDHAWHGLQPFETDTYLRWEGNTIEKSLLLFDHTVSPWDNPLIREAAAFAIDRTALDELVTADITLPLQSPLPAENRLSESVYPAYDQEKSIELLSSAGYSETNLLEIELWFTSEASYERDYATELKDQWEATGLMNVTLRTAPQSVFKQASANCTYQTTLIRWPTASVQWVDDPSFWLNDFIRSNEHCMNYQDEPFIELLSQTRTVESTLARNQLFSQIQTLWGDSLPTIDLLSRKKQAYSSEKITQVVIDPIGRLEYRTLRK